MYNELGTEELSKEQLINDDQFLDDASEFLRQRTGNLYVDPEEIFDNYLSHMRFHSSNDITPVRDLMFAQKADPEMKDRMSRLFQSFDKLESNANDDLLEVAKDYGISVLASPSTWLGFLTAGAGKVASLGTQQAARAGVRGLLYQGIAKAPITSGAITGAAVEGTAGYAQEKARQMARVEVGAQEEEDKTALGASTLISGALGGVGGGLTGLLKQRQVAKASSLLDDANEATREATEAATARAEQTIADNADAEAGVKARLRPLDEDAVAEGKELREQLSANELFIFDMDVPTKKAITAAAIDLVGPEDLARDPQKRITEIVADRIRSGDLTTSQMDDIAEKYNLSREQLSLIFTADVSDAARTLQLQGQLKKGVLKKLANDIEKLSDEVVDAEGNVIRRGAELSEQQGEFIADIANGMGFLATEVVGGVKGFERMRRAILTSQPQTTIRNFAGGAARILIDMPETLIENVTRKILNVFGAKYTPDSFRSDSMSILKYMNPIVPTKENRVVADVIANMFESRNPEAAQRLFGTFIDAAYTANKGKTGGFLEGVGSALNFANRFADNYYKKAIFTGELNRYVKSATINGKTGRDLMEVIADGDFNKIDSKLFNKATDKSFELLYQKYPTSKTGAGRLARAYLELDKQAGSGILLGTLVPFPRFVANQIEFIYDHAPIIGMLSSKSAPEKIAKQITGMGMIMGAYGMRVANGEENMWYEYQNEDGSVTDLRPFLGPLSMPFYMADLLYRHYDSSKSNTDNVNAIVKAADAKVVSEIMIGSALRVGAGAYFAETALPELVDWAAGVGEDSDFVSSQKFERAMGRFAGDYVATFSYAMPLSIARDLYKITDAEARLVNETNGQVTFGDIFTVRASRALPQPLKEKQIESLEKRPLVKDRYVITSEEPTETRDPATTALTGLARSRPKTELEKELTKNGLTAYDLYKPIPFGPADVLVRRELSGNGRMPSLSEYIKPLLRSRQYAESDKKTKKVLLKNVSKDYVSQVRGQVFDVLLAQARDKKIDYSVEEVMRLKFESEPVDNRDMAVVEFRNLTNRKPDLKDEKDLKLLIEISKQFVKQFSIGGLVTDEAPQQFNEGGMVGDPLSLSETVEEEDAVAREQAGEEYIKQMTELGLDMAPVTGEIRSFQAGIKDFEEGNPLMGTLGVIGALPIIGIPGRAAKKAIKMAVNVKKDKKADVDYAELLISGDKKFETRDTPSLNSYVGQRVGIAKTGDGEAKAIGSVEIGEPIEVDEKTFRELQDQHLVPEGSEFDIKPGGKKYLYPVSNPERFDSPKSVGRGIVSRKILDDMDYGTQPDLIAPDAEDAMSFLGVTKEAKDSWRQAREGGKRVGIDEEVSNAAQRLKDKEITNEEFMQVVQNRIDEGFIPQLSRMSKVPDMPTLEEIAKALTDAQVKKGIIGLNKNIAKDPTTTTGYERIASRLDIPAYNNYDTWVVSIHEVNPNATGKAAVKGAPKAYAQTAVLKNVEFATDPSDAIDIARRKPLKTDPETGEVTKRMGKATIARIVGDYVPHDPKKAKEVADQVFNDPEWTEVGMNPYRASYFYDKLTGEPVIGADEVIQIGPLVMAKGVKKTTPDDPMFRVDPDDADSITFNEGGLASDALSLSETSEEESQQGMSVGEYLTKVKDATVGTAQGVVTTTVDLAQIIDDAIDYAKSQEMSNESGVIENINSVGNSINNYLENFVADKEQARLAGELIGENFEVVTAVLPVLSVAKKAKKIGKAGLMSRK